ncbi:MAG: hypothetical protein ACD_42C00429G0002 [uncultured bacterium]|nr:MAG: hypothetical protein ACD_42C00429G0002 [uncultured bacterium]OGT25748.1 MAG: hypothetical protein A3B71_01265 [Gammaproteobacteria bacterium RIFCSPHIGHO2_02_FULL_42_43]OGT51696.1 MAG: hypothetical protein A3E54_03480 [Gammaproteobacteria bacterium RIFCSPHIGHO2_12_FULL_41_25]OGT61593.1 MAG: hypothetical protein A3I77_03285 [Gammaproteobacteria bacterium RIFCSPLOWO2_02_FULL_42_14]OGT86217.1 MAG: hypothetical protein A3G86_06135 [Gammaproteobacteria bacterium RIFCSPLOWO2_12_FULL_42_18]
MIKLMQSLLEEFHDKLHAFQEGITREVTFPNAPNKIMVAIGMRRTGKTYFLFQTIKQLLENKIPLSRILYVNFEDDRLYPLTQDKLGKLIDAFYTIYPDNHDNLSYLFLDEIHNVDNWAVTVRRFFDSKKVRIYLSGSSSKLLGTEIATSLRGRSLATEIWPLNFSEFLQCGVEKNIIKKPFGKKGADKLSKIFQAYLNQGGFPEIIHNEVSDQMSILQEYVNVVILKDIIERHKITNIALIRYLIKIILMNPATHFSTNKLFNDLKSQGYALSRVTIHEYLSYIEEAYLAFMIPLYSKSTRKAQTNSKKIYAIDTGLVNAYNLSFHKNWGHNFENFIFLNLKRQQHEIYYYLTENRNEVDFFTKSRDGKLNLYQVAWDVDDPKTLEREMRALHEAEHELGIKGKLITPENYLTDFVSDRL